ncbi:AhpC/TSA family protein [Porphyromonadaceae bacterium OttesenSCG-928-L07]|nr:AhpC/TSA family protein [Porphyromonadaceae bacterium OttesenSCG-928-L07]MDL2252216.1 AhpC/TSA family protein [Odoribacter sp. OttesenSCG-928-J03]
MTKFLLPLIAVLLLVACNSKPHYTIKGTVEGAETGNILLLTLNGREIDTLIKAPLLNKKFNIEGDVQNVTHAYLMLEGQRNVTQIILENNQTYTANINVEDEFSTQISGSENQKILNEFIAIVQEMKKYEQSIYQEFSTAMQTNDEATTNRIKADFIKLKDEADKKEKELIKKYSDSYVAALIIAQKRGIYSEEEISALYNVLGEYAKATEHGKTVEEYLNKVQKVAVGQIAPDFTLKTPEGQELSLYGIQGKVKIIDFWASWCGPCRKANPDMVDLYKKYHKKGLEIIGVSLDRDKENWVEAIKADKLTWHHGSDLKYWDSDVAKLYMVNSIPHLIILDADNRIVAKNLHGDELNEAIIQILKK